MNKDYVDVRGVWPSYVKGEYARTLVGAPRHITVEQARDWKPEDERWAVTVFPHGEINHETQ